MIAVPSVRAGFNADLDMKWEAALPGLRPDGDEVHVWRVVPQMHPSRLSSYLSLLQEDEQKRAMRFRRDQNRFEYVWSHGALRIVLSEYLQIAPEEVRFAVNPYGRPYVCNPAALGRVYFSLSHTDGMTLIALSGMESVGVDVERHRFMGDLEALVSGHFTQAEIGKMSELSPQEQLTSFLRCWTRKEAVVKATGFGLSLDLSQLEVTLLPQEQPAVLGCSWDERNSSRWTLADVTPAPGYIGAVALGAAGMDLRCFTLDH